MNSVRSLVESEDSVQNIVSKIVVQEQQDFIAIISMAKQSDQFKKLVNYGEFKYDGRLESRGTMEFRGGNLEGHIYGTGYKIVGARGTVSLSSSGEYRTIKKFPSSFSSEKDYIMALEFILKDMKTRKFSSDRTAI